MIAADVALAEVVPARLVVAALGLGNTIGQTLVAIPLFLVVRRIRGPAAVQGAGRAALAGLAAACAGVAAGVAIGLAVPVSHRLLAAGMAVLAAAGAVVAFGVVAYLLDDGTCGPSWPGCGRSCGRAWPGGNPNTPHCPGASWRTSARRQRCPPPLAAVRRCPQAAPVPGAARARLSRGEGHAGARTPACRTYGRRRCRPDAR